MSTEVVAERSRDVKMCSVESKKINNNQFDSWNLFDACMLMKGYAFVPQPPSSIDVCVSLFARNLGCRSARGEIYVGADGEIYDSKTQARISP